MPASTVAEFPQACRLLVREVVAEVVEALEETYSDADRARFQISLADPRELGLRVGAGSAAWTATGRVLENLQEAVMPGLFGASHEPPIGTSRLSEDLSETAAQVCAILFSYFKIEMGEAEAQEAAAHASLNLLSHLPIFRTRAGWNLFASLKDPAVWDAFVLRKEDRRDELGRLDLIPEIDRAITARDPGLYRQFLREKGFDYALDYQRRLIKRSYPGWRALLLHDIAHTLALGGISHHGKVSAPPTPFLPRVIAEHAATLYQTDLHPETVIGDANFLEHPHRGITTGQTGSIGIGCVLYPCTLGGVTDKVKPRHPMIGDFVLIGTDVGIFGPVSVGAGSVIGPNTEINGMVAIKENVRIRAAVVARTVITETGKPGSLIFEEGTTVGEECLVINDHPRDLVIPAGSTLPAHSHVVNDGRGGPKIL
jgi:serine acetyltransferase